MSTSYLYLICRVLDDGLVKGPCKIGRSDNPAARLKALQTASPHKLIIYELWDFDSRPFAQQAESLAHAALKDERMVGEWFEVDPKDALGRITLWFHFAAHAAAQEHGNAEPIASIPPQGVGMVANGRADNRGRMLS